MLPVKKFTEDFSHGLTRVHAYHSEEDREAVLDRTSVFHLCSSVAYDFAKWNFFGGSLQLSSSPLVSSAQYCRFFPGRSSFWPARSFTALCLARRKVSVGGLSLFWRS